MKNVGPIRHFEPFYIAIHQVSLLKCRYCRTPPAHRCSRQRRQRVTEGTAMALWNGPNNKQEALLWQSDRARHLSVEILQLQNISLENPIVWQYLRDSTFSRFDTIPECDRHTHRQTDRHTTTAYTGLSIASRGKNRPYCTTHQL